MPAPTIADLGEDALLTRLFPLLPAGSGTLLGPGDDAAVVRAPDARVVVTTDVLVEDRHFRLDWSSGEDVGWRAAVQNLADVAAMGAVPTSLVVALVVPATTPVAWVEGLGRGLAGGCPEGVGVVGGDLSGGEHVAVAVTALGDLAGRAPVRRSGARPGDVVAHAGVRGHSAAGYAWLAAGRPVPDAETADGEGADAEGRALARAVRLAVRGYRRPVSPLVGGPAAADAGATAMLDVSDGLLRDAGRLARASGVVVHLDPPADAFGEDLAALAPVARALGADAEAWVLAGGEDHGLLATFPADASLPAGFRRIGVVGAPGEWTAGTVTVAGRVPSGPVGWDHFRG
ncbi:thiamine-phosphate kinase [Actinotalea fermentans]|uniref:Thiamine-monophosphate kinase n=1 Tax=Actinotalea fermentans TaxID=43671 RepID=A0A511YTF4_9CELL|nr:thiamine-monophosphate kinase [Actinotalea fermentans]